MEVEIFYHEETDKAIKAELPQFVILEITYSEPGLKGDTATNASKKATLETGAEINVPLFVNTGDKIKVDTSKRAYVERAK
jgi:elongation factor P